MQKSTVYYILLASGGPDGELAASLRYLSQRFSMITPEAKATLNDIGISVSKLRIKRPKTAKGLGDGGEQRRQNRTI